MSILNDQQNDNLIKEENNDIKAKNEELEKIKKEIEEKTKYLIYVKIIFKLILIID